MARILGLIAVLLVASCLFAPRAHAATYTQALASCNAYMQSAGYQQTFVTSPSAHFYSGMHCAQGPSDSGCTVKQVCVMYTDSRNPSYKASQSASNFTGSRCDGASSYSASYGSNITVCNGGCIYAPDPGGTTDSVRSGTWVAQLVQTMYRPTGQECASDAPPPPPAKNPTICGGGSCHDTAGHNYCAVDGSGTQFCVPESTAGGSGGCATSGNVTICAGKNPPLPPNPPISDPSGDIAASDTYGHQDGTGSISNTTVNNYNNSGSAPQNGAAAGDAGDAPESSNPKPGSSHDPASSSSTGNKGDGTSASGGGDCNTPPICEGAAATCMVVSQTYLLRCPPGGQGTDTSGEAGQDGNTDVPGLGDIGEGPGAGFMRAEDGLSKLDTGGLGGGGTCPTLVTFDLESYGVHMNSESLPWCDILEKVGYMILFLCAFISLRILSSK